MTEAPKHVWLHPTETVSNKESWIDDIRVSHPESYVDDSCEGVKAGRLRPLICAHGGQRDWFPIDG